VSIFNETVMILRDIVLSVILLNEDVLDIGGSLCRRRLCGLRRSVNCNKIPETLASFIIQLSRIKKCLCEA
jgi:hypothetical protein